MSLLFFLYTFIQIPKIHRAPVWAGPRPLLSTFLLNFSLHTSHRVPSCESPRRAPTPPRLRTRGPYLVVESLSPTLVDVSNGVSSDTGDGQVELARLVRGLRLRSVRFEQRAARFLDVLGSLLRKLEQPVRIEVVV